MPNATIHSENRSQGLQGRGRLDRLMAQDAPQAIVPAVGMRDRRLMHGVAWQARLVKIDVAVHHKIGRRRRGENVFVRVAVVADRARLFVVERLVACHAVEERPAFETRGVVLRLGGHVAGFAEILRVASFA